MSRLRPVSGLACMCMVALGLLGCSGEANDAAHTGDSLLPAGWSRSAEPDEPIDLVATTGHVADLARHVGGAHVRVTQIIGAGVDPHLYQPREADIRAFDRAEAILFNGLHLEGRLGDVLRRVGARKPVLAVAERLPRTALLAAEDDEAAETGEADPHVWFDPGLWQQAAGVVAEALAAIEPAHAATFRANAEAHRAEIQAAYEDTRALLAAIPTAQRVLVTAHDAFRYFGRAYDVEVLGIQGLSTESEAGVRRIEELVGMLVERRIPAVFVETSVNERNVRALVEGAAARGHTVSVGGVLYSDALGEPGTPAGTYVGMLRQNATTIAEALR